MFKNLIETYMKKSFIVSCFLLLFSSAPAFSLDATDRIANTIKIGDWMIAEFSFPEQLMYRIAVESKLQSERATLYFDLSTKNNCKFSNAVLTQYIENPSEDLKDLPFMPMDFKISKSKTYNDIPKAVMDSSTGFFFLSFNSLTVDKLLKEQDKGNLSTWIHPDANGNVKMYKMYFPLNGFSKAYKKAIELCQAN